MQQPYYFSNYTGIYTNRYYLINSLTDSFSFYSEIEHNRKDYSINIDCGKYKATYNITNAHPPDSFGLDSWKSVEYNKKINVSFYEENQLLFTKTNCYTNPCIIIHCLDNENQTKENTLFSIREEFGIKIYSMNTVQLSILKESIKNMELALQKKCVAMIHLLDYLN